MITDKKFPEGFYWGEKAWEAFARLCQIFLKQSAQKYRHGVPSL